MKVESRVITIQIDIEEWKQIEKDWQDIKFGRKEYNYKIHKYLDDFLDSIHNVSTNQNMKVEHKLGTY